MTDLLPALSTPGGLPAGVDAEGWVLARCEQVSQILGDISSVTEAKAVADWVSTLDHATKLRDLNAHAVAETSALRLRAERRIGELIDAERSDGRLASMGGARVGAGRPPASGEISRVESEAETPMPMTLADYGITYDQAADYAKLARVENATFEEALEKEVLEAVRGVTRAAMLRRLAPEPQKLRPVGTCRFQVDISIERRRWLDSESEESGFSLGEWLASACDEIRATPGLVDGLRARSRQRRLDWDGSTP